MEAIFSPNEANFEMKKVLYNRFSKQEIAEATGISMANIGYNLKSLRRFSVIDIKKNGSTSYLYWLAIPIEEAVRELRVRGFSPVALVG